MTKSLSASGRRGAIGIAVATLLFATARPFGFAGSARAAFGSGAAIATDGVRAGESEAGDLVADAIRAANPSVDICFVPAAAFKPDASVPRPASGDQASGLVDPSSDTISVVNLRGDKIIAALERSVSFEPQPFSGFLQVSGLRFTYDPHKDGGKRIASVTVNGQPLDAARSYKIATTRPLAHGQDGYYLFWDKSDIVSDTPKTLDSAIKDYAKSKGGTVSPALDGRITEVGK